MIDGMDRKQREEFDSTLNSGVSSSSWAHVEGRAWERLQEGEFDRGTDLGGQALSGQGGGE
jgi:hypothetical protein